MLWLERKNIVWLAVNATDNKSQLHNRSHCKDFVNTRRTCRKNLTQAPMPLLERKCTCLAHGHSPRPHYPRHTLRCAGHAPHSPNAPSTAGSSALATSTAYTRRTGFMPPSHRANAGRAASIAKKRASSAYVLVFSNTKHFENVCQQALTAHVF